MFSPTSGNWSSSPNIEYWNKGNSATTVNNNKVYKTIYSPSLTNYVEPKSAAFSGFITIIADYTNNPSQFNVNGSFNRGWNFYSQPNFSGSTIFLHALGFRGKGADCDGFILDINTVCAYWVANPASNTTFRLLVAESSYIYPNIAWPQAAAANIRPATDQ